MIKPLGSQGSEKKSVIVIIKSKSHSYVLTHFVLLTDLLRRFYNNLHLPGGESKQLAQNSSAGI